jgi:hypothetical protein
VNRPLQQIVPVFLGEVRRQALDAAHVEAAVRQHGQEHRVASRGPGHRDAQVGLGLREMEHLGAPREHRRGRLASVELAPVHLGHVGHELGLVVADLLQYREQVSKQRVVGDGLQVGPASRPIASASGPIGPLSGLAGPPWP